MPLRISIATVLLDLIVGAQRTQAQFPDTTRGAAITRATQADHQRMLALLGIDRLRPGTSPQEANTDESIVLPYTLPDPLVTFNGQRITTPQGWWEVRRPEIMAVLDREVYGRMPANVPPVHRKVISITHETSGSIPVVGKKLVGRVENNAYPALEVGIELTLVIPAETQRPVPVILHFSFAWPTCMPPPALPPGQRSWRQQVLARGWGYSKLYPTSYQAHHGAGLTEGVIGLTNRRQPRKPDDWGVLRAWAWGASRALDYFQTDPDVDAQRIGIAGLSRYGKAALLVMAYDPRFAIGLISSSGASGAKLLRRVFGEQEENLTSPAEYHWFAGNFLKYAGPLTPDDLPVDAHSLIALVAPRLIFIGAGNPIVEGHWVDAHGTFLAAVHADSVYRLLGKTGLDIDTLPPLSERVAQGEIAFRMHEGGHTNEPNWPYFLKFSSRYFESQAFNR
jgi:hypothetical protein